MDVSLREGAGSLEARNPVSGEQPRSPWPCSEFACFARKLREQFGARVRLIRAVPCQAGAEAPGMGAMIAAVVDDLTPDEWKDAVGLAGGLRFQGDPVFPMVLSGMQFEALARARRTLTDQLLSATPL